MSNVVTPPGLATRRWIGRLVAWTLLAILAVAIVVGGWLYAHRHDVEIDLFKPGPEALLAEVVSNAGLATAATDKVELSELDGTEPASARQSFRVSRSSLSQNSEITAACLKLGFKAPDVVERSAEPSMICRGYWKNWSAAVYLDSRCAASCIFVLTTKVI